MNQQAIKAAQQFSAEHFANLRLDEDQFKALIGHSMSDFDDLTDKVIFLSEVIRLGNIYLNDSQTMLREMERREAEAHGLYSLN